MSLIRIPPGHSPTDNMSNNSSTSPDQDALFVCQKSELFWSSARVIHFASYYVLTPIYSILGVLGHGVLLLALYKQAKTEQAYAYQIFLVVNETLEIISFTLFSCAFLWGGVEGEGAEWYTNSYPLMWFTARGAIPLSEWLSVNSLLLSVSMTADRAFALTRPFVYKNINHGRHQMAALIGSTVCSLLCNLYNVFLFDVVEVTVGDSNSSTVGYVAQPNIDYLTSDLSNGLAYFCDAVRICAVLILVSCNVLVVRMFRARRINASKMTGGGGAGGGDNKEERKKKLNERTLISLTVCQSSFVALSSFSEVAFYTAAYIVPYFNDCESKLLAPVLNSVLELSALGNTFTPFLISRQCRLMVAKAVPCTASGRAQGASTTSSTSVRSVTVGRQARSMPAGH